MTNKTEKITLGHEIIRAAMKQRDLDFSELAEAINEKRPDKVSLAVRCTTGNHRRSIEIRKKVAQALDLDPAQVWDEVYLKESQNKKQGGNHPIKPANKISKREWKTMSPASRVRALAAQKNITLEEIGKKFGVSYKSVTNHIYGITAKHEIRLGIAKLFAKKPEEIWPDLYSSLPDEDLDFNEIAEKDPVLRAFWGFGDLHRRRNRPHIKAQ